MIKENQMELNKGIKATSVRLRINTRGDVEYYPVATAGDKYIVNAILGTPAETPMPSALVAELNKTYAKIARKERIKRALKKTGKVGLWAFIAYQVVGLTILMLNFNTIWSESIAAGNAIAQQLVGGN